MRTNIDDLSDFVFISNLLLSPDGKMAAFIKRNANKEKNGYDACLHIIDATDGRAVKIFEGFKPDSFCWLNENSIIIGIKKDNETEFEMHSLDGNTNAYLKLPFHANIEAVTKNGSLLVSSSRPINKEKAEEDGRYKTGDIQDYQSRCARHD